MGLTTKEISSSSFNDMISSVDRRSEYVENRAGANVRLNNFLTPYTLDDKSSILNAPCGYSNGVYPSLRPVQTFGPELITNGDFATDSNWTKGTGWSIANGKASRTAQSGSTACDQSISLIAGKKYKIVYTLTISAGSFNVRFSGTTNVNGLSRTTSGTYIDYLVAATGNNTFRLVGADGSFAGSIDNVSVKEATDADFDFTRGSAATRVTKDGLIKNVQILSDELVQNGNFEEIGPEEVTNGDFATDLSGWQTSGVNAANTITWEYNGVRFFCTNQNIGLSQQNVLTIGKAYKLTCDVNVTTGSIGLDGAILVGGSTVNLVNGFNEIYFVANSTTFKIKRTSTVSDCLLDNVSVKEVGQNWNFVGDTKVVNNGAKFDNTSVYSEISQDNVTTSGSRIRLTITVEDYVGGKIIFPQFGINSGNGDPNFNVEANGTYVFEGILYNSAFTIKRGLNGTNLVVSNVSIIEITDDTDLPRIDYTDGTGSLLLEPQRTNLINYSEDFSQSVWVKTGLTVNENKILSPSGSLDADEVNITAANAHYLFYIFSVSASTNYTFTFYAKKGTATDVSYSVYDSTNNADIIPSTSYSSQISNTNWTRITVKFTTPSGCTSARVYPLRDGSSTGTVYIWGAQLEQGSYATSYIPTSGSTVTRNADVCNNAGSSDLINSTEGVLYAEILPFPQDGRIALNDGTTGNNVRFTYQASNNTIFGILFNGSNQAVLTYQLPTENSFYKIAFKYKASDFSLYVNGVEVDSLTSSGTTFASDTLSQLDFDAGNGLVPLYGNVRSVAVFKEALTDEELAKITSTTQQEVFYEMRDKMLQINADYYEFGDYTTRLKKLF